MVLSRGKVGVIYQGGGLEQRNFVTFYGDFAQKGRGRKKVLTFLAGNGIIIGLKMRMILKLERGWEWKVSLAKFPQLLLGPCTAHLDSVELRALGVQHLCSFFAARQRTNQENAPKAAMFALVRSTMFATANKQTCDFGLPKSDFLVRSLPRGKE